MNTNPLTVALPKPSYHNRPGTLLLRGNENTYGRCTLVSRWHQDREGYPKDYDFNVAPKRSMNVSSYRTLASLSDPKKTGATTYQTYYSPDVFEPQHKHGYHRSMISRETFKHLNIDRELGQPKHGYGYLLPRHSDEHHKMNLITSYSANFGPPYPFTAQPMRAPVYPDLSPAYRKCKSQFTDPDGLRPGKNTWHDESGFYSNSHFKRQLFKVRDPITKLNLIDAE